MMTVRDCYEKMGGNFDTVVERLGTEELVERFMYKFLNDGAMAQLKEAVAAGDVEESFQASHLLKGIAGNLSFTRLAKSASALTEQLRARPKSIDLSLFEAVEADYNLIVEAIEAYRA